MQHCPAGGEACCLNLVFPYLRELDVEKVEEQAGVVLITARCRAVEAACHRCGFPSARVNSRYRRRLHDLAAGGRAVVIDLEVRRFFCGNPACQLRTFAEQVPAVAPRHQHPTVQLRGQLEAIGLALGVQLGGGDGGAQHVEPSRAASASIRSWRRATVRLVSVMVSSKCLPVLYLLIILPASTPIAAAPDSRPAWTRAMRGASSFSVAASRSSR